MARHPMKMAAAVLLGAVFSLGAAPARAQTYDFVADFSTAANPNGAWTYGWEPYRGGPFTPMDIPWTDTTWGLQEGWAGLYGVTSPPSIALAVTDINHPTVHVPAGTVNTHPGPGGENAVVRWTAPASGTYRLEGWFTGNDFGFPTSTDVAVLRGPLEVFSSFLNSFSIPLPFSATMPLLAGETVDLTVGYGNGNYYGDSTGLAATFTKVSELACTPPPAGLVGWWAGDGTARDLMGRNDGSLVGDATFGPGLVGQAFGLDGDGDFVAVPDAPSLDFGTGDFTVALWVRFDVVAGQHVMAEKYVESYPDFVVPRQGWTFTKMENEDVRLHLADTASSDYNAFDVTPPPIPADTWILAAFTRAGDTFTIYWNGVALGSATFSGPLDLSSASSLKLGHRGTPQDTPGSADTRVFDLDGSVDEAQVFGRALSADEIRAIFLSAGAGQCRTVTVTIDVKPGGFPNAVNPRATGAIPVAVLGTATFDAATVDPASVRFGATGTEAAPAHHALQDVNGDGTADLILQFPTAGTGLACGMTTATLTGRNLGGLAIQGTDSIVTTGCR